MSKSKRWAKKKRAKNKNNLHNEMYTRLNDMYQSGCGRSRKSDKALKLDDRYIYSSRTYETYKANSKLFIKWVQQNNPDILHLQDCGSYANPWIQTQIDAGYSAWTISTRKAAIAKLLNIPYTELIPTPSRCRANIQKSRAAVERDRHISKEREEFFAKITSATGLRRNELLKIKGTDLHEGIGPNGESYYYLRISRGTKGGKIRDSLLMGATPQETEEIVKLFLNTGSALVCPRVPNAYDNHYYRSVYAKRLYGRIARHVEKIPPSDRYVMRKERAGEILDRKAMLFVSRNMGHSREDVIAQSYLY